MTHPGEGLVLGPGGDQDDADDQGRGKAVEDGHGLLQLEQHLARQE